MPRKFDHAAKQEWLDLYEQGKSEKWIAGQAKCDIRTVKSAINEARLKRDVVMARVELVKEALRGHQNSLLEEVDRIVTDLVMPERDLAVLSWHDRKNSVFGSSGEETEPKNTGVSAMRRLLREHLRQDRLWRLLAEWERARGDHMDAKARFQRKVVTLLEQKTGHKVISDYNPPPSVCSYTTGPLFYKTAIDMAFSPRDERAKGDAISDIEAVMSVDVDNHQVTFEGRLVLAVAPGSEERTKQRMLDALKVLARSQEVNSVVETYRVLEQITTKTRQVAESVRLLGLVPGQCEICRRLGM